VGEVNVSVHPRRSETAGRDRPVCRLAAAAGVNHSYGAAPTWRVATTDDHLRFFPYDQPYPNQREAMDRVGNALARGQDVLFEGAPGTGKTLSALVPALQHAREHDRTVVITTNVHQQMRQFVEDARAINAVEPINAVVFRGKSSMCHIEVSGAPGHHPRARRGQTGPRPVGVTRTVTPRPDAGG